MLTLYGIPNCDKCRAARKWLTSHGIEHQFHDVRRDGLDAALVTRWQAQLGDKLVNTRGRTWREFSASKRAGLDTAAFRELILKHPTLIKRPLLDDGEKCLVGYDEALWRRSFAI